MKNQFDRSEQKSLSISQNSFSFTNKSCDTKKNTLFDKEGKKQIQLRIRSDSENLIHFHYRQFLCKKTDFAQEHNILMDFISLPYGQEDKLVAFFDKNGFIFETPTSEYSLYKADDLHGIIRRIKNTVEIITELQNEKPNYGLLLQNCIYLLISERVIIDIADLSDTEKGNPIIIYRSCPFKLYDLLGKAPGPDPESRFFYDEEEYVYLFSKYENSKKTYKDYLDYSIGLNFLFSHDIHDELRKQVDFLYKIIEISSIESIDTKNGVIFTKQISSIITLLTDELKENLIDIAKKIVKVEVDYNIKSIRASYDTGSFTSSWSVPNLLTALYFSIFFLNPNFEIVKKCNNPSCAYYFSVLKSNRRKKYCSQQCANAMSQRKSRERKKLEK